MRSVTTGLAMALTLALAVSVPALGASKEPSARGKAMQSLKSREAATAFASSEHLLAWINGYRVAPEPERLPAAVKAMVAFGLVKDLDAAGIYIGFTAGVLGSNPEQAERMIGRMFPLEPADQVLVIKAIAYSGLANWREVMTAFVERMPARKVLIDKYLFAAKPTLEALPFEDNSSAIDINWGYYFATGAEAPVRRIVGVLAWAGDRNDVDKLTIGAMAKWTLAQNASRDQDLLAILKGMAADTGPDVRPQLHEVIEAAETLELAKVRKQAMAAIEELRSKGSESSRNFSWWGQAGQTVLALGCVAASVAGQVEFGIPCVVGGALSSAALKYLAPGQ